MRLLQHTPDGGLGLTENLISDEKVPPYAILSHTWQDGHEVTFDDLLTGNGKAKAGYNKILFCAQQAQRDSLDYCWVDTCCIDKSSSAELTEALNSMFRWYQNAQKCYVYLSDVSGYVIDGGESFRRWEPAFRQSRWFTRGWTLQELIAPKFVEFFSKEEELLGSKSTLDLLLHEITGIPVNVLRGEALSNYSVTERFSWAAKRQTTRVEDESYCLLGIFGIHLPVIYGEGRLNAMKRLLNEVEGPPIEHLKAIKNATEHVRSHVTAIQENQDKARHSKIVNWLSLTNYPAQQSDIMSRRQQGTGQWFLDAPEFTRWLSVPKGTLFCQGIPGAGKTMVAAIAVDHLLTFALSSSVGVAYVYCNYKAQKEQEASGMLAALIKQLVQARPSIMEPVEQLHKQHIDRGTKPLLGEIFGVLRGVILQYTTVYVVVDALDECGNRDGTRHQFLTKLQELQATQDVRLLTTSRFIPEIEDAFKEAAKLEVRADDKDVRRFVAGQMYRLPKCVQRDPMLQEMVLDKIVRAVDGMFLLARLNVDSLLDKKTPAKVKTTLANLTKGSAALSNAYKDAVRRIEGQLSGDHKLAKQVLSWITYAKRPLTTAEICCALAVEPGKAELDPEDLSEVDDLVSVCAGLVVVDQESTLVRLVHYTTQEYFESIMVEWNPWAQLEIASICLTYLSFDIFKTGSCFSDEEFEERLQENKFLDYTAKHWSDHVATVEGDVFTLACSFLSDSRLVSNAMQVFLVPAYKYSNYSQKYPKNSTGLHLAARLGLSDTLVGMLPSQEERTIALYEKDSYGQTSLYLAVESGHYRTTELLVEKGAEINAQGGTYGNALQAASYKGHEAIVKLLIEKGAKVNAQGGRYNNALQAASYGGHEAIVKLLIEKGAEINARGEIYGNALQAASFKGHEGIVKLLIEKGAEVNVRGGGYGNALQAASDGGHEAVVKLLIEKGAEINLKNGEYGNALRAASYGGHEAIVKLLVEKGAEVNAEDGEYGNALQAASHRGQEAIVKLLIENGAEVNAQGGGYSNALQAASDRGHKAVVKLLVEKGAEINAQGGIYGNVLQEASYKGHEAIVKLLIEKGAEVNAQGGEYGNALHAASYGGHEAIVKFLVEKGAEINSQNGGYGNALQAASYGGHEAIVKLLIEKGAEINAQGGPYGNALQAASYGGQEAIVKLLIEKGAEINAQGGGYGNALQAASYGGHEAIVKLLIEKGAEINVQNGDYRSALQAASDGGHEAIVKLLVEKGAEINAQGGEYGNALQAASGKGHEAIVKLLIEKGAEINAQDGEYSNVLQAASYSGREAIVKLLIEKGAEINAQGGRYGNALQAASYRGREAIVKLLIEKGAEVNSQCGRFGNALQAASGGGHEAIVKLLIEKGAEVNAQGGEYGNALQAASYRGRKAIVKLLVEKGAEVNSQGGAYGNALQAASDRGHKAIVRLLVKNGAGVNA